MSREKKRSLDIFYLCQGSSPPYHPFFFILFAQTHSCVFFFFSCYNIPFGRLPSVDITVVGFVFYGTKVARTSKCKYRLHLSSEQIFRQSSIFMLKMVFLNISSRLFAAFALFHALYCTVKRQI